MFDKAREIVWLLNLMNLNDKRSTIELTDIFDSNSNFKVDADGNEITITINNDEEYRAAQIEYCLTDRD